MSATPTAGQLAAVLALRPVADYAAGTCVAWMDSADRTCAKATDTHLCARHTTVATRKLAKLVERERARRAKVATAAPAKREAARVELERVERRLDQVDPMRREVAGPATDPAVVNTPLATRLPSASRVTELAQLHSRREQLERQLA